MMLAAKTRSIFLQLSEKLYGEIYKAQYRHTFSKEMNPITDVNRINKNTVIEMSKSEQSVTT